MKTFRSVLIAKYSPPEVVAAIRDRLPELVPLLDDVEAVVVRERRLQPDGSLLLVNQWKARPHIPAVLASTVKPEMLTWTDRALWDPGNRGCRWQIESHYFGDRASCQGTTCFEPAMGDRGTRITFEGTFEVKGVPPSGVPGFLEGPVSLVVESLVTSMIPKNFRKLTEALAILLKRNG